MNEIKIGSVKIRLKENIEDDAIDELGSEHSCSFKKNQILTVSLIQSKGKEYIKLKDDYCIEYIDDSKLYETIMFFEKEYEG